MRKSIYILISFLIISSSVFSQIKHENYYQESIINSSYPKNLFSIDSLVQINDSNNFLVKKKIKLPKYDNFLKTSGYIKNKTILKLFYLFIKLNII